jgi:hypothetical protein
VGGNKKKMYFICFTDLTVLLYFLFSIPVFMRAGWNRKKKKKKEKKKKKKKK